ncbi:MAG TPA: Smr/MutS family protein [Polyangiales bacterium]|nr:Smr/MutS family protein [Polyangiales bacterium]
MPSPTDPPRSTDAARFERTLRHLEWSRLAEAWLARCSGQGARRMGVRFAETYPEAQQLLAQTAEAAASLNAGEGLPLSDLRDLGPHLERLARDGVLDAAALADVRVSLQHALRLRRFLGGRRSQLPALFAAAHLDPSLDALEGELAQAIGDDGTLRDDASDTLSHVRAEIAALRERIVGRLEDVIAKQAALLSDSYYTLRDGRYVLPVRRDAHDRLLGIVHGASSSGASIFVEPRAVVAHGNRLKMAEAEQEREELRILAALSDRVRERLAELNAAAETLNLLDLRHAAALLARDYKGSLPELSEAPIAQLRAARHPGLVLDGVKVVPNDIEISAGHALVVSGPNAGGKTVVLKTLGLCALMARAGMLLPVGEGSRLGFFDPVLSELGDDSSTATNLSTFSAHVRSLVAILAQAKPSALVLLDELATGTDPGEGGALACALTQALCERGAALVVTTHYEALKALAERDERLRSASVGFDPAQLQPTFELLLDVPGASSALAVARRFGLPDSVIAAAERFVPDQARDFEQLVRSLSDAVTSARTERAALESERRKLEAERREQSVRAEELAQQSKRKLSREAEQLMNELRAARSELDQARTLLRKQDRDAERLAEAEKKIQKAATPVTVGSELASVLESAPGRTPAEPPDLSIGARVYVPRLRSEAVIVEGPQKNKVLVAVGAMKLWVDLPDLRKSSDTTADVSAPPRPGVPVESAAMRSSDNTLDVRGLRADDALAMVDSFIDRLYGGPQRVGYVLHGHGSGALRNAVREHLRAAPPYVQTTRPGVPDEGGDAITVFYLE